MTPIFKIGPKSSMEDVTSFLRFIQHEATVPDWPALDGAGRVFGPVKRTIRLRGRIARFAHLLRRKWLRVEYGPLGALPGQPRISARVAVIGRGRGYAILEMLDRQVGAY